MKLEEALPIAERALELIKPHCFRAKIAGSIRRRNADVKDIEIVAIPKPYERGLLSELFESDLATVVNQWEKVKGEMVYGKVKYTQRILPEGIKLDLFFATPENWGLIYAIRTGSAEYSHKVLARGWVKQGYRSENGYLMKDGKQVNVYEEEDLYRLIRIPWITPEFRIYNKQFQ
ncbi:MAG: hypothetical protein OQJ96_13505 [Flavobacteriales bacterium]|nr:hypothetical protein [Flavobacteriales bacterium]MCW8912887.1 hypothetical protein [Flavobacteriales bacterium]MCW8937236.1 hypothetical protein [Flavobacteriales bacterium]MCW8940089.1 hypothetical protein [Flavobacteriales bacterium]MCW8967803.1 hypothetical protein [Flavobacteriales bacterium]